MCDSHHLMLQIHVQCSSNIGPTPCTLLFCRHFKTGGSHEPTTWEGATLRFLGTFMNFPMPQMISNKWPHHISHTNQSAFQTNLFSANSKKPHHSSIWAGKKMPPSCWAGITPFVDFVEGLLFGFGLLLVLTKVVPEPGSKHIKASTLTFGVLFLLTCTVRKPTGYSICHILSYLVLKSHMKFSHFHMLLTKF